jgi:DNA (cytosine-5)-methyltransferase 1
MVLHVRYCLETMSNAKLIPYVSLFTGCGGIDLGLETHGQFEAKLCVELDASYCATLRLNKGTRLGGSKKFLASAKLLNGDVFSDEAVHEMRRVKNDSDGPWVVTAGPPCQSFSTLGHRKGAADPRGDLTFRFFDLLADLKPTAFVFENVPPLGHKPGAAVRKLIFEKLRAAGYSFEARMVNMADYGCFTKRQRFIIVGSQGASIGFPEPGYSEKQTLFRKRWLTTREALEGISDPYQPNGLSHHDPVFHTDAVKSRFLSLLPGQYDRKRHRSKLDPDGPGPTLVAGATGGYCHHIHWESRELTSRESARLHGFPDAFKFAGSKLDVAKQIANSIPVQFGTAMGEFLYSALNPRATESNKPAATRESCV